MEAKSGATCRIPSAPFFDSRHKQEVLYRYASSLVKERFGRVMISNIKKKPILRLEVQKILKNMKEANAFFAKLRSYIFAKPAI
jgi:hypothetical protein